MPIGLASIHLSFSFSSSSSSSSWSFCIALHLFLTEKVYIEQGVIFFSPFFLSFSLILARLGVDLCVGWVVNISSRILAIVDKFWVERERDIHIRYEIATLLYCTSALVPLGIEPTDTSKPHIEQVIILCATEIIRNFFCP